MNQGETFKKELKKKKLTQEDAAKALGISLSTIIRMFKEKELEVFEIELIKEKLNITIPPGTVELSNTSGEAVDYKKKYYEVLEMLNKVLLEQREKK